MLNCGLPYAQIGEGGRPLVVLDSFRVEHRTADGLVLQGMMGAYERYTEAGRTVYLLERPIEMPIDYTFDDMRNDYIAGLAEIAALTGVGAGGAAGAGPGGIPGLDVLGIGAGGMFALAVAAAVAGGSGDRVPAEGALRLGRLVVVAAGARMSAEAREAAGRWQEAVERLRWRSVHREMVRMSYAGAGGLFYGTLAWLFPELLGTTDYPWDFHITLREVAGADLSDRLDRLEPETLFIAGGRDRFFPPDVVADTADRVGAAETRFVDTAGHAITKSHRSVVESGVLRFLADGAEQG